MTLHVMNCSLFRHKTDLVRAIQQAEGYEACFKTDKAHECGEYACLWRDDCVECPSSRSMTGAWSDRDPMA